MVTPFLLFQRTQSETICSHITHVCYSELPQAIAQLCSDMASVVLQATKPTQDDFFFFEIGSHPFSPGCMIPKTTVFRQNGPSYVVIELVSPQPPRALGWTAERAQWLRPLDVLLEGLGSVPRTHVERFATTCNSKDVASGDPTLSTGFVGHLNTNIHINKV